jgi:asparagine synthase (glutamine-hydrolysing)
LLVDPPAIDVEAEHLERARGLAQGADRLARAQALYQDTYLPGDVLNKVDRASMACGLEVRAPLLDAALVDSIQRLPSWYKLARGRTKRILKRAAAGRLPSSILGRPKRGFCVPVARWLRGPLGPLLDDLLGPDRLARQGLFRPGEVARRIREHREGIRDHRKPLWTLLMFQLWYGHWIDRVG